MFFLRPYDILFHGDCCGKSEMKRLLHTGIFLMVMLLCGGAVTAGTQQKEAAALSAAKKWLALVDKGNYSGSWREAAGYFRNAVTREKWEQSLQACRQPLGKLVSRKVKSETYETSLPGAPDGNML
jgi:hypothetical protein